LRQVQKEMKSKKARKHAKMEKGTLKNAEQEIGW
jgi:hypothetical protein